MKQERLKTRHRLNWAGLCVVMLLALSPAGFTQDAARQAPEPAMVVIPERAVDAIQKDIDNALENKDLAAERRALAEDRLRSIDPTVQSRKQQMSSLDQRKNEAKRAKRESELVSIEAEKRATKQVIDLLDKLKELRKAEVDAASVEIQLAEAQIRSYQLEAELAKKRSDLYVTQVSAGQLTQGAMAQVVNDLEARLLKLQEEQANATQKLASKEKEIVARRMSLFKAQVKLGTPQS